MVSQTGSHEQINLRHWRFGRAVVLGAVLLAHLFVIPLVFSLRVPHSAGSPTDRMTVTFLSLPFVADEAHEVPRPDAKAPVSKARSQAPPPDSAISVPVDAATDWHGAAERAAAAIATQEPPNARTFGMPARDPPKRKQKPFGWDKTHTQRVEALPEGGLLIRLSDRCALVLAPLPLGGCALGKIEARGDLFDGMNPPTELGDWKETGPP